MKAPFKMTLFHLEISPHSEKKSATLLCVHPRCHSPTVRVLFCPTLSAILTSHTKVLFTPFDSEKEREGRKQAKNLRQAGSKSDDNLIFLSVKNFPCFSEPSELSKTEIATESCHLCNILQSYLILTWSESL